MFRCPNCGAALGLNERFCPDCGAPLRSTRTRNISIRLSRRDARRGCVRVLRYPGAPKPIRVRLPKKVQDGAELYLNDVSFLTGEGEITKGALRIRVQVERRRVLPFVLALLLVLAAAAALLLYTDVPSYIEDYIASFRAPEPTAEPAPTAAPAEVIPTPMPYVSPLRPMQQQAAGMIPNFELRYFLMELDDRLLENFCALYSAVANFQTSCSFPAELDRDELRNLMLLLSYECPELLQFSSATEMSYLVDESGRVLSVELQLGLSREQWEVQYRQCAAVALELARSVQGLGEEAKELAAYNYLAENCYYDFDAVNSASAYGALVEGRAKCDGISLAMKWICEEMGISCMVISGTQPGQTIGHAWNIVCIDGTYYDLDVTNDVMSEDRDRRYYGAFNVSRRWIRDKYPDNLSFSGFIILPGSQSMGMSLHALSGGFVYEGEDYESLLFTKLDNTASGEPVYLQFESGEQYRSFIGSINDVMSRWQGVNQGSFNFSMSHLDEFQVCCITVSYI